MNKYTNPYFLTFCLFGFLLLTSRCSSSSDPKESVESEEPEVKVKTKKDEYTFLQVAYKKWEDGKFHSWKTTNSKETRTIDNMNWYNPNDDYCQTAWGGRIGLPYSSVVGKEGFFRVARCAGRFYFLDPDNGAVILHGIQHVHPETSSAHRQAFNRKFGNNAQWSKETGILIADNHINYISYGSKRIETFPVSIRANLLTPKTQKIAYAENLYLLRTYMWDMNKNLGYTFNDDKYNRLVLLFEPTFATYIDNLVQKKSQLFVDDQHFVGYYLDNELPFASYHNAYPLLGIDLNSFLSLPERYRAARTYAEVYMREAGIDSVDAISEQDEEAFRGRVANYYYKLTTETIKRYDTTHLILGSRLHDWSKYNQKVVDACAHYCDVVSINFYGRWQLEMSFLANLKSWCGTKPFFISEFYTKAEEVSYHGMKYSNTGGGGWLVHEQKNRGEFYQNFCLRLIESSNCVGWVHFEYNDSYFSNGKYLNKGIVSIEYKPYEEFLQYVRQLNLAVYSLIDYYDEK